MSRRLHRDLLFGDARFMARQSPPPPPPPHVSDSIRVSDVRCSSYSVGGLFCQGILRNTRHVFTNVPGSLRYELAHTCPRGHNLATVRWAGPQAWRTGGARFESSEALAEQPAVARTAAELHRCCARVSRAAALVRQHVDGVARAGSAGFLSGSSGRSLWSCSPCWRLSREPNGWRTR